MSTASESVNLLLRSRSPGTVTESADPAFAGNTESSMAAAVTSAVKADDNFIVTPSFLIPNVILDADSPALFPSLRFNVSDDMNVRLKS